QIHAAAAPPIVFRLSNKCGTPNVFGNARERVRLNHLKIFPWCGRAVHPHAASDNKSLSRILLQLAKKWFQHSNIILRQGARDLGREHFLAECCWVIQRGVRDTSSKTMLEACCAWREISAKAAAV